MIGAGTIISPIIRIVTTVAILGAVYLFFVKPTLDTTKDITNSVGSSINESFDSYSPGVQDSIREARKLQKEADQSSQAQIRDATKLLNCINDASGNVDEISACNSKFSP
jgi:hypothetical protein